MQLTAVYSCTYCVIHFAYFTVFIVFDICCDNYNSVVYLTFTNSMQDSIFIVYICFVVVFN